MKDTTETVDLLVRFARGELEGELLVEARATAKANPDLVELAAVADGLKEAKRVRTNFKIEGQALNQLARRMFRDYRTSKDDPDSCVGVTVYDSKVLPLPEGVRPAAVDVRKLKYKMGAWEVELAFYPITVDSFELMGHITGLERGRSLDVIAQLGRRRFSTKVDEQYLFRFPRMPAADYTLLILEDGKLFGRIDLQP